MPFSSMLDVFHPAAASAEVTVIVGLMALFIIALVARDNLAITHTLLSKAQNRLLQDCGGVIFLAFCGQLVIRDVFYLLQWA